MRAGEIEPKKLVIFDIDDTLVYTQTKVHVVKDGGVVNSLNSHDFTHYKLQPGEEFDFGDFRNAKDFFDNSKPNIPMMNQLKRDINTGNKVVMVTARADFDDKELFLNTFRKFGVDMSKVHVYRAGNSKQGTTEERKKSIIKSLLDKDDYTKAIMYDDAKPNLHTFIELKKDHPQTRFYAWHVSLDGNATEYMRESVEENFAKDTATSIKLIKKYYQTGDEQDAFAAIKHGWNFIKNPKMRSIIVNIVKKVSTENGYPNWNETVAYIKKNTGIDVSNVNENFADGKVKGKSRPGRVKRAGASCNGSVTDLRKRAKNSSGEKAKMLHWCANMKSGKKK